ncbi:phosphatase PAP2 family protein [Sandaracinus amylolyticus]|uniref:Phosphatidic acid phosphatase type 2/haloperoxidase domain-containing protein n=1 Tax=Sandaracinus amylolyticus TaxID=927083 RepID=A0A0F6YNF8_9BACT|nr:phosphatase PAP2 family protein [Sandaracinus amylolyticus]AKF10378.1 hypothetical protein DB32_007527 [Sandaracinus amylolyticus]
MSRHATAIISGFLLCAIGVAAAPAAAQEPTPPHRAPPRTRIDGIAAPITGGLAAAALGAGLGIYVAPTSQHSPDVGVWRGGIVADEPFRDLLRASSPRGISIAGHTSDALMLGTIAYTALVDSLLVPLVQGDLDLAWQASLAHSLAFGLTLTAGGIVKRVTNRARPYERECATNPSAPGCQSHDIYESFYSLHTGLAATSAGFSCALHLERNLFGDLGHDIASCGGSIAAATVTGLLRVVADRHYLSDVIIGGLLGFAVGYLVPMIVIPSRASRLEGLSDEPRSDFAWSILPMASPGDSGGFAAGASVFGTF